MRKECSKSSSRQIVVSSSVMRITTAQESSRPTRKPIVTFEEMFGEDGAVGMTARSNGISSPARATELSASGAASKIAFPTRTASAGSEEMTVT